MTNKEMKEQVEKEMKELKTLLIEGIIVSCRYGSTKFDDTNKYRFAIKSDSIPYDDIHAYDNVGAKLTPSWMKEKDGYINLSSIYDVPVMDTRLKKISFTDWMENYNTIGSKVLVKIKQKDGAIYPEAIKVLEDGEERDPFKDM